jgi:NADH-quinone oxidoreductase subunit L
MMFAVGTGGLVAAQFHLMSHAIFKACLFLCAGSVIHAVGSRDMRDMGGLGRTMKVTAASFFVGVCALAGIPIFNGFWSKDMIFAAAYRSGNLVPLYIAVLTAALTVAYSFKAFAAVFLGRPRRQAHGAHGHAGEAPLGMAGVVAILAFGAVVSWLLIGVFTRSYVRTGLAEEPVGIGLLLRETLAPTPALFGSAVAIALGFAAFFLRRPVAAFAGRRLAPVVAFIRSGYGFDAFYYWIKDRLVGAGRALFNGFDERVADGFDNLLVAGFRGFSGALRRIHTGDLSLDVLGIMLGFLLIAAAVFLL